jgi:hypothetical protein
MPKAPCSDVDLRVLRLWDVRVSGETPDEQFQRTSEGMRICRSQCPAEMQAECLRIGLEVKGSGIWGGRVLEGGKDRGRNRRCENCNTHLRSDVMSYCSIECANSGRRRAPLPRQVARTA